MKVVIIGKEETGNELFNSVCETIEDLGLNEFVKPEHLSEEDKINEYSEGIEISKEPALIIEEPSIEFKDVIFEGFIPEKQELNQMFVSIIGGADAGESSCGSDGGCGSCSSAGSCGI